MKSAATLPGLVVTVSISCLLHGALVFAPLFGKNISHTGALGETDPEIGPALRARLLSTTPPDAARLPQQLVTTGHAETLSPAPRLSAKTPSDQAATGETRLFPLVMPQYYPSARLTKRPQPTSTVDLNTPEMRLMTESGTVILILKISPFGEVVDVEIENSDISESVSRSAMEAFRRLHFTPGEIQGQPVASLMKIEVSYGDER